MNFNSIKKYLIKNYKKIIVVYLVMLLLSNKMYEKFTTVQALDSVKSTEKKVNDMFYKVDKDWISTNKNIYSSKEIKSNVAVKVGNITLAKKGNKIWAPNMQVDNITVKGRTTLKTSSYWKRGPFKAHAGYLEYMDTQNIECPNGEFLSGIKWHNGKNHKEGRSIATSIKCTKLY